MPSVTNLPSRMWHRLPDRCRVAQSKSPMRQNDPIYAPGGCARPTRYVRPRELLRSPQLSRSDQDRSSNSRSGGPLPIQPVIPRGDDIDRSMLLIRHSVSSRYKR